MEGDMMRGLEMGDHKATAKNGPNQSITKTNGFPVWHLCPVKPRTKVWSTIIA